MHPQNRIGAETQIRLSVIVPSSNRFPDSGAWTSGRLWGKQGLERRAPILDAQEKPRPVFERGSLVRLTRRCAGHWVGTR